MKSFEKLQPLAGDLDVREAMANVAVSLELGLPEAVDGEQPADVDHTIALVNPGPSAKTEESLELLNSGKDRDGNPMKIVLCNAGYLMLDHGLNRADAFLTNHPASQPVSLKGLGDANLTYYLASMCPALPGVEDNPSVFDHLLEKKADIRIWHAHLEGGSDFGDRHSVGTGSGAPVAALALFAAMGYRKFEVFGMDGSSEYAVDLGNSAEIAAYLDKLKADEVPVQVGDRVFTTAEGFLAQTREVEMFLNTYPNAVQSIHFTGDTANAALFNGFEPGVGLKSQFRVLGSGGSQVPEEGDFGFGFDL